MLIYDNINILMRHVSINISLFVVTRSHSV